MPEKHNDRTTGIAPVATVYMRSNTLTTVEEDIYQQTTPIAAKRPRFRVGGEILGKIEQRTWITRY
jgi:hypothetical protein